MRTQDMNAPLDDVDRIMSVMERAFSAEFGEAWNRRQVCDALLMGNCRYGLIGIGGEETIASDQDTAGFFMSRTVLDEEELLLFAIIPDHRRKGLGHLLLSRFLASSKQAGISRVFLEMRKGNPAALLYEAHGFQEIGVRPAYYRTPDGNRIDAISQELIF